MYKDVACHDCDVRVAIEVSRLWFCHELREAEETVNQEHCCALVEYLDVVIKGRVQRPPVDNVGRHQE